MFAKVLHPFGITTCTDKRVCAHTKACQRARDCISFVSCGDNQVECRLLKFQFKRGSVQPHFPLMIIGCVGGCNRTIRDLLADANYASVLDRSFFLQGPPSVAIHGNGGGGGGSGRDGGDDEGGGNGDRRQGRAQMAHQNDGRIGGRQTLGRISQGSQRVNGEMCREA